MNKLPCARLVAEFGVIVVGIPVALLAGSAWQERGDRAEEREILARIDAELALDSTIIQDDVDWFRQLAPILEEARAVLDELLSVPELTNEMGVLAYESVIIHEDMLRAQRSLRELRDTLASVR